MAGYAVGILQEVRMGPPIVEYLEKIDATLAPFDGHFIIHGGAPEMREGVSPGTLIVIEFPDTAAAAQWYASAAYREIVWLRTENSDGTVFLIGWVAGETIVRDTILRDMLAANPWLHYAAAAAGAVFVVAVGKWLQKRSHASA